MYDAERVSKQNVLIYENDGSEKFHQEMVEQRKWDNWRC